MSGQVSLATGTRATRALACRVALSALLLASSLPAAGEPAGPRDQDPPSLATSGARLESFCVLPTRQRPAPEPSDFLRLTPFTELEPNNTQATANFIGLGFDPGEDPEYDVSGTLTAGDIDFFSFDVLPGDVLGVNRQGVGSLLQLLDPAGALFIGSSADNTFIYPVASPLPGGGGRAFAWVVDAPGTLALRVSGGTGAYTLQVRLFRPGLQDEVLGTHQTLFVDFDGATINAQAIFGQGSTNAVLSPLSSFLAGWGLTAGDENAVIDAVLAVVAENIDDDVKLLGANGDFEASGIHGQFDVEILNSRDHADPFGQPNVSRLIVGGTISQLGISTIGIAESIDPGNYEAGETAVILLDLLSAPAPNPNSLNTIPRAPGVPILDLIGVGVGNITAHEAGHYIGNWHTNRLNAFPCIMDSGGSMANITGIGPDGTFGTADDIDVDFINDQFATNEGFTGTEHTLQVVSFGCSTGMVSQCGNGVIDPFEVCDAPDLGGQTCVDHGFEMGTLGCAADCSAFDTSGCFNCRTGLTSGSWNQATLSTNGAFSGTLFDPFGVGVYKIHGSTTASGRLSATLSDGLAPDPDYYVRGSWTYTFPPTHGSWGGYIYTSPLSTTSVGKISGTFRDDPAFPVIGTFGGEWKICP